VCSFCYHSHFTGCCRLVPLLLPLFCLHVGPARSAASCFLARCFCLFARSLCLPVYLFALPALRLRSCFAFRPLCSHSLLCFPVLFSRGKRFLCEWPSVIIAVVGGWASLLSRVASATCGLRFGCGFLSFLRRECVRDPSGRSGGPPAWLGRGFHSSSSPCASAAWGCWVGFLRDAVEKWRCFDCVSVCAVELRSLW
jgi:hypothetical protein